MANAAGSAGRCDANGNLTCIQDGLAGHKSSPDCKPLIDNTAFLPQTDSFSHCQKTAASQPSTEQIFSSV